jgi:hypothetical protein
MCCKNIKEKNGDTVTSQKQQRKKSTIFFSIDRARACIAWLV